MKNGYDRSKYMSGKGIEPIRLHGEMSVADLMEVYAGMGFNARRLSEAAETYIRMIESDATICLTLAGAMTPIGMSGAIISLLENGWVDWIISTGANLYHDMHRPFGFPVKQGDFMADDDDLEKSGIARIYDVFIEEGDTMLKTDAVILRAVNRDKYPAPASTADLHYHIGMEVIKTAPNPEKSLLGCAAALAIPIYSPSPGDSSIGMNMILNHLEGKSKTVDPILDVLETAAIVRASRKNGALIAGGGAPKNFFMQTQPTLWQILKDNHGGHDFFIQITTDAPHWGGLSGATPSEAKSWGKVKDSQLNNVTVYSDASIALPLLTSYLLSKAKPRKPKRLLDSKKNMLRELREHYLSNRSLREEFQRCLRSIDEKP